MHVAEARYDYADELDALLEHVVHFNADWHHWASKVHTRGFGVFSDETECTLRLTCSDC